MDATAHAQAGARVCSLESLNFVYRGRTEKNSSPLLPPPTRKTRRSHQESGSGVNHTYISLCPRAKSRGLQSLSTRSGQPTKILSVCSVRGLHLQLSRCYGLDGRTVLHVADKDIKFGAACFLKGESSSDVWEAILVIWVSPYVGYPDCISCDQGPQFQSNEWKNLLHSSRIKLQPSGVESHNALGVWERYGFFLRHVFNKFRTDSSKLSGEQALSLAIKVFNDTAGPNVLVPTILVLGIMPRLPIKAHGLPDQVTRLKAMKDTRDEVVKLVARTRLAMASTSNVPAAADTDIKVGDKVLMFREKPVGKWSGPFVVVYKEGKF